MERAYKYLRAGTRHTNRHMYTQTYLYIFISKICICMYVVPAFNLREVKESFDFIHGHGKRGPTKFKCSTHTYTHVHMYVYIFWQNVGRQ